MKLSEFLKLVITLFTTDDKYEITFNLCDNNSAGTYTIEDFLSLGDFMNDNVLLKINEYYVQILKIEIKD